MSPGPLLSILTLRLAWKDFSWQSEKSLSTDVLLPPFSCLNWATTSGARPGKVNFTYSLWRTTTFSQQFMPSLHSHSAGRGLSRNWNQPPGCEWEKSAHCHWHPWDVGTYTENWCLNHLAESVHSVYGKLIPVSIYGIAWRGKMFDPGCAGCVGPRQSPVSQGQCL